MTADDMRSLARGLQERKIGLLRTRGTLVTRGYNSLDEYYSGTQPLGFLHPEVRRQVENRLTSLSINWARVIIGSIEERLDIRGFRLDDDEAGSKEIWQTWQDNNLDEWSQLGHVEAMKHGRAFGLVWADTESPDKPRITVESAQQMNVEYKPGTTRVIKGCKVYQDPEPPAGQKNSMIGWLYLPDTVEKYRGSMTGGQTRWDLIDTLANPLGVVPIVPIVNRPSLINLAGESELTDVIPLLDAVNKLATDMMVSSEFHAMPRRYATGMEVPREARANERLKAEVRKQWDEATKGRTWLAGKDVTFGQFPEATLDNFINAIKLLISQIAAIAGLPPHYLGITGEANPASADAIRSAEASLVRKALRKQTTYGGSWEELMRLAVCIQKGIPYRSLDSKFARLETWWADPTTPTPGAKADAALKLTSGDHPIITVTQAREDLGYSPVQIGRMAAEEKKAVEDSATQDVRARLALADELMSQGLSRAAAYAAVGLLAAASQMTGITGGTAVSGAQATAQAAPAEQPAITS